ncbi:PTS sugar transporter subunit IIA [Pediococcus ethanolidurans]|uniref:PTS system, mannose-specific IIA component n=1 Tax=Pediococcus ethanolidurans TaxID=319653 RepID=A0A1H9KSA7_9LACO|nr:hypothetical protein [Pediococcus ethanolidurans]GEN94019.1 hypothetical protein PET01_00690 [Pediococcus ethanolidurans]SER02074.1 PTS system, mannose-specific IIA component [Pediococcus ethanolidurans]
MNRILVASHGKLASGLKSSIELLSGLGEKLSVIDAYIDDTDYTDQIDYFIKQLKHEPGVILTDIKGGSVNQRVVQRLLGQENKNVFVITGVNLPLVMSFVLNKDPVDRNLVDKIVAESKLEVIDWQIPDNTDKSEESNSDFFN